MTGIEIENLQYSEQIFTSFDYFNAFTDTLMFVEYKLREAKTPEEIKRASGIVNRLADGNQIFMKTFWTRNKGTCEN